MSAHSGESSFATWYWHRTTMTSKLSAASVCTAQAFAVTDATSNASPCTTDDKVKLRSHVRAYHHLIANAPRVGQWTSRPLQPSVRDQRKSRTRTQPRLGPLPQPEAWGTVGQPHSWQPLLRQTTATRHTTPASPLHARHENKLRLRRGIRTFTVTFAAGAIASAAAAAPLPAPAPAPASAVTATLTTSTSSSLSSQFRDVVTTSPSPLKKACMQCGESPHRQQWHKTERDSIPWLLGVTRARKTVVQYAEWRIRVPDGSAASEKQQALAAVEHESVLCGQL